MQIPSCALPRRSRALSNVGELYTLVVQRATFFPKALASRYLPRLCRDPGGCLTPFPTVRHHAFESHSYSVLEGEVLSVYRFDIFFGYIIVESDFLGDPFFGWVVLVSFAFGTQGLYFRGRTAPARCPNDVTLAQRQWYTIRSFSRTYWKASRNGTANRFVCSKDRLPPLGLCIRVSRVRDTFYRVEDGFRCCC